MKYVTKLIMFLGWIFGVVIANGLISTVCAIFIPYWAWYLTAERILLYWGLL